MTQWRRVLGAAMVLLLLGAVLSACGSAPVPQNWPGLTVTEGAVYAITGQPPQVYVLDAENGNQQGTFIPAGEHQGPIYWSPVTFDDGLAYVGFSDSQAQAYALYAFELESRQEHWNVPAEDLLLAKPTYTGDLVYFGASDGQVYAADAETGQLLPGWSFQADEAIWAPVLVVEGRAYAASMDHHLYCLDAQNGELLWDFEAGGALAAQPVLRDGVLYFGAFDGRIYAVDAESGEVAADLSFQAENWIWSEVLFAGDLLYVTALDGKLYGIDPSSGDVVSPFPYDAESPLRAAPVQAGELIVVAAESGKVTGVDGANASMRWEWSSSPEGASLLTTPSVRDGIVYFILDSGDVYALEAETGVQQWSFSPPEPE